VRPAADRRAHLDAAVDWLCAAQDAVGGGVARAYSVSKKSSYPVGWQPAYPETTGYIIPTFFDGASRWNRPDLAERARKMADWELTVQLPDGAFPGSVVSARPVPVVFNTGMILLGLCRAYRETRDQRYASAIDRAAGFLGRVQSADGAWRQFTDVENAGVVHAYDVLVCTGLLAAADVLDDERLREVARRNLEFTLTLQQPNGWFSSNGLTPKYHPWPPTHTIGYVAAGLLGGGLGLNEPRYVEAARRLADAVLRHVGPDGFLAAQFDSQWTPDSRSCCLTGNVQVAIVWWQLYQQSGDVDYARGAMRASDYVKCRQDLRSRSDGVRGGIAGSFPIEARYGRYQYLNWAAKFFIDALMLEDALAPGQGRNGR
jgi:hypothetical protein